MEEADRLYFAMKRNKGSKHQFNKTGVLKRFCYQEANDSVTLADEFDCAKVALSTHLVRGTS
jgi:hypothetical protein